MKKLNFLIVVLALLGMASSCQPKDPHEMLSSKEDRDKIIVAIANDKEMSHDMMGAMMDNSDCKMMMMKHEKMPGMVMENHDAMMAMMKHDPAMMKGMMTDMMEACKGDTSMTASMCKSMMGSKEMMDMMEKMKMKNMDMNKMKGSHHK